MEVITNLPFFLLDELLWNSFFYKGFMQEVNRLNWKKKRKRNRHKWVWIIIIFSLINACENKTIKIKTTLMTELLT